MGTTSLRYAEPALRALFWRADQNQDGNLSREELQSYQRFMETTEKSRLNNANRDLPGYDHQSAIELYNLSLNASKFLQSNFDQFDTDKNGGIGINGNPSEFSSALEENSTLRSKLLRAMSGSNNI